MIRYIFILLLFVSAFFVSFATSSVAGVASADSVDVEIDSVELTFEESLPTPDSVTNATVTLYKDSKISLDKRDDVVIDGFRIRVYFDNSQGARAKAAAVKEKFEELFPDVPAYLEYSVPYFLVSVGDFMTHQEAYAMLQRVIEEFPKSFVKQADIPVSRFGTLKNEEHNKNNE